MIQGYNLTLNSPSIEYKSQNLILNNIEVKELIETIQDYFKQVNTIYSAELTLSNNVWETQQSDYGKYKKRKDYTFRLMDLTKIILYTDSIEFHIYDDIAITSFRLSIEPDFFWFLEWEPSYYE